MINHDGFAHMNTLDTLKTQFGFDQFLDGQEAVVERLLQGRSTLAVFPTGGGKSLCYQLPALMLDGLTLVISPLLALMKDQIDFLTAKGIPAGRLDSTQEAKDTRAVYDALRNRTLKLLYVSPERLGNERFLQSLRRYNIALLAVDEAHCISQWGHNFRPDYLRIAQLAKELAIPRVLALTATATPDVSNDIAENFGIAADDVVNTGFYRPNLTIYSTPCNGHDRDRLLLDRLTSRPQGPTIVYVTLQKTAERVAELLAREGFDARFYHAGMKAEERQPLQDAFMASDAMVVVATIAFGMGIDKSNIRYVYHYNLPKSTESYSQEIGRAGRDGEPSICELFASREDVTTLENFSYGDTPTQESVAGLVRHLFELGETFDVSNYDLSYQFDIRTLVTRTLLTYMELEGLLRSTGPFYSEYKFQPNRPSGAILADFDAERQSFLTQLFRRAKRGKTWFTLDVVKAAEALGEKRERIVTALGYLEERGDLTLRVAGVRQGYRRLAMPADLDGLIEKTYSLFLDRERQDIARVHAVLDFAGHDGCLVEHLLDYFGAARGTNCGHCSFCEDPSPRPIPEAPRHEFTPAAQKAIASLRAENHEALSHPRQLARFLCGLPSPKATRARLSQHPMFGRFGDVPFMEVLEAVE